MKKLTLLSVAAAALLFVGCGEKPAEANATEATATEMNATEATETEATETEATTTEATTTEATTTEANTTEATETEATATEAAPEDATTAANAAPAEFAACAGCHGPDGKMAALGKSAVIAGQSAADIESKLKEYKAGTRNVAGMGASMQAQAANLSDDQIKALAEYISKL